MNRRMMVIGVVVAILAISPFLIWPLVQKQTIRAANQAMQERTKALVDKNPQYQAEWKKAMEDGVLTYPEAKAILEKAGEKVEPEE